MSLAKDTENPINAIILILRYALGNYLIVEKWSGHDLVAEVVIIMHNHAS